MNPDSPEEAAFRIRVAADIARIEARGGVVDLPGGMASARGGGSRHHEPTAQREKGLRLKALRELASFHPVLTSPDFHIGVSAGGAEVEPGVLQMPYFAYSAEAEALMNVLYNHAEAFSTGERDWPTWKESEEAKRFRDKPDAIRRASFENLADLFTVFVRQDRFVDESVAGAYAAGYLTAITARAGVLADELADE